MNLDGAACASLLLPDALFHGAVHASLAAAAEQPLEDLEHASAILPTELRNVLRLSPQLRHCFGQVVLRRMRVTHRHLDFRVPCE